MSLRSKRHAKIKDAYDELALIILKRHHIRTDPRDTMRPWTLLNRVIAQTPERVGGGYEFRTHINAQGGNWVETLSQVRAGRRGDRPRNPVRERKIRAVDDFFTDLSRTRSKLNILQAVLNVLDVDPDDIPTDVKGCQELLSTFHVVIWDVVGPLRDYTSGRYHPHHRFNIDQYEYEALRQHLRQNSHRIFPREEAKNENLQDLLRLIF